MASSKRSGLTLTVLTCALVLTSCANSPTENPGKPDNESAASSPSRTSAVSDKDDPLDNGGHAEVTWSDYVESQRELSGLDVWPEVDRIRYVSLDEAPHAQADCLTNQGFPASVGTDGSMTIRGSAEQESAQAEATYICALQYPMDLKYSQAFTRDQFRTFFAYYRDELIPCLQGQGLDVAPLPSEETFVEGNAMETAPWTPYDSLNLENIDVNKLNDVCPPTPSEELLYGG